jgi:hypothetical protein
MRYLVYGLILAMVILHQDFWWWQRWDPLVLGFIPVSLAWHVGISVAAGLTGAVAVRYCWPESVDVPDDEALPPGRLRH